MLWGQLRGMDSWQDGTITLVNAWQVVVHKGGVHAATLAAIKRHRGGAR
jgi:hypothetical protein